MQEIIAHLEKVLHCIVPFEKETFTERIDIDSHLHWRVNFPVAVVHHRSRMDERCREVFEAKELIGTGGLTPETYAFETLRTIASEVSGCVKQVSYLCLGKEEEVYRYLPKRDGDKWKKVIDNGTFKAVIELSVYDKEVSVCEIESQLRNLMRSSKEIPSLKEIGFVWIAVVPKGYDISIITEHYFPGNWLKVDEETHTAYIGWSEKLGEINMRHFVCPPQKEAK